MPLMMDDDMDVDINDLFGDGADLALPSRTPPSKELHQRVDELRGSGCCQSVAWSKWGSIASIHPNGTTLEFRNLRCHPDDGTWALSEPSETPQLTMDIDRGPLKHLSWSPNGAELAVIDSCGRITILLLSNAINKPTLSRHCQVDPADDLHAVVGCLWLNNSPHPNNRNTIAYGPAIKEGSGFKYDSTQAPVYGPYHPINTKSAFICVTTNGMLRALYPQVNGKWYDTQQELESIVSSEDLITHASIRPDKTNILLIAFATASKQLRTVRALIDFGNQEAIKKAQQGTALINVMIRTRHIAVTSWLHDGPTLNASHMEPSMVQLSHLEIMQPTGDPNNRLSSTSVILAVRSHLPISTSHYNQDVHTTIDRWEIREKPQVIHPAFEQLSSRRNSVGTQPGTAGFLKKLQSITVNKVVIGIQPIQLGKYICFTYSDGSVEYRDRNTMAEVFMDGDLNRVLHLSQIGFSFVGEEPCLQTAISPTFCSMVQMGNDGKIRWRQLEYQLGETQSLSEDAQYAAVVAAFTISSASAVVAGANIDDILATVKKFNKDELVFDWPSELTRMLKSNVDYSEEAHYDPLIRNTVIQLCLSIQVSLGFKGEFLPRSFAGKFGWVLLQLRSIVVLVTMAANVKVPPGPNNGRGMSPLENPGMFKIPHDRMSTDVTEEVVNALAGSVRWALDLMAWITDTLLALSNSMPSLKSTSELSLPRLMAHLRSTNNIAPHLLICSATRGFLNALCRRLTHLDWVVRSGINHTPRTPAQAPRDSNGNIVIENPISPALRASYIQIATLTNTANVKIPTFEKLLSSLGSSIKTAYSSAQIPSTSPNQPNGVRNGLELKMLFGGDFPDAFQPVVVELFSALLPVTREEIDPGKLFFQDFSLLEVDDDDGLEGGQGREMKRRRDQGMTMDSFSKRWLQNPKPPSNSAELTNGNHAATNPRGKVRWRRCARCTAVMEDILSQKPTLQWLVMQHRRCFCSGQWDTLNPGHMVA